MKLATYLAEKKLKPAQFADQLGKHASTITRLLNGRNKPRLELMELISTATDGAVTASDFLSKPVETTAEAAE